MTAAGIEPVARRLLGDPNRAHSTKTEWRYGRKGSLAVDLKKNVWHDYEAGEGGGVLDLICRECGGSHREARDWLHDELGLGGNGRTSRRREGSTSSHDEKKSDRRAEALALWEASGPALHTPAEAYLQCRGIVIEPLGCIRYHAGKNALVALVQDTDGTFSGVQRIYLAADSRGTRKTGRFSLGPVKGGAVRLTPTAESIQLCESVEDGLALLQMTGKPTWAVPGAGFMESFEPPPEVREIVLAPDHDKAGLEAIEKARVKPRGAARIRRLLPPPGKDWCDVLDNFEERAAIREFDGEEDREQAETRSWVEAFCDGD
jgi:hypothetical protein